MPASSPSLKELFLAALAIAPADRAAWLERECGNDPALQLQVEQMLAAHDTPQSLLDGPALVGDRPEGVTGAFKPAPAEAPGTMIGPYKLLELIGEGGMGLVYLAEQRQPIQRRVALKIIKPGMDSRQVVARFEAERQALALMDHPNIAKVFDAGTIEVAREDGEHSLSLATDHLPPATVTGRPYFVMELVRGTPITDYCDQHRLTTRQRLALFVDVCHAVQHAHQKGIIHRDLKPSNVMVSLHDVTPVVKVIDFGIAKATGGRLTDKTIHTAFAPQLVGTPLYMSPEQAGLSDLDVDTRGDVYSLGVLLSTKLLSGTTPCDSETLKKASYDEMRRIIREDEPPRLSGRLSTLAQAHLSTIAERRGLEPRRLIQQVRGELDWIVMKALEKDRNRRYESASAFAADVQRYLDDEPVQACPPSKTYRLRKYVRRHKAGLGVAAMLLTAVLLGGSSWLWWAQKRAGAEGEARRWAACRKRELQEGGVERWPEAAQRGPAGGRRTCRRRGRRRPPPTGSGTDRGPGDGPPAAGGAVEHGVGQRRAFRLGNRRCCLRRCLPGVWARRGWARRPRGGGANQGTIHPSPTGGRAGRLGCGPVEARSRRMEA